MAEANITPSLDPLNELVRVGGGSYKPSHRWAISLRMLSICRTADDYQKIAVWNAVLFNDGALPCTKSIKTLAKEAQCSVRTFRRYLAKLKKLGWIKEHKAWAEDRFEYTRYCHAPLWVVQDAFDIYGWQAPR